uniref:Putative group ii salivary lipocalin n=1 Tax=Rhipicephalus pulchellus TaxID=72859 RepID=L7MBV2_RHIPC
MEMLRMFTKAFGLFMLFAAYAAHAEDSAAASGGKNTDINYEDNPEHFHEQNITYVAGIEEQWFITRRNVKASGYTCHSAKKVSFKDGKYTYQFKVRNGTSGDNYIEWKVEMTPLKTPKHREFNAVSYKYLPDYLAPQQTPQVSKLMTDDLQDGCALFVTVTEEARDFRACMLVQTKSTAGKPIPYICEYVYKTFCPHYPGMKDEPWDATCQ